MSRQKSTLGIDLGLDVLHAVAVRTGYRGTLSAIDIADVCGCTRRAIYHIEHAALDKLCKRINEREHSL